jgi:AmmeMemoRadiSam system protein B
MDEKTINPRDIRESPIAGHWYPGTKADLERTIDRYLAAVPAQPLPGELVALVAPHAGYIYSGQVAAYAYKQLVGKHFDTVVVTSPSHGPYAGGVLVTRKRYYRTPLGLVEVASDLVQAVDQEFGLNFIGQDEEHSLEIQLPFLQRTLGDFRLVPLMLENQSYSTVQALSQALTKSLPAQDVLLVASTDLSHFYTYDQAVHLDKRAMADIGRFDAEGFDRDIATGRAEACGHGAVVTVLLTAKARGADKVTVLRYANSGDVTGDRYQVVGYGAAAITKA